MPLHWSDSDGDTVLLDKGILLETQRARETFTGDSNMEADQGSILLLPIVQLSLLWKWAVQDGG